MTEITTSTWGEGRDLDPLDWAISVTAAEVEVFAEITDARRVDPRTYPGYFGEVSPLASARRIVGRLLDAGWTPPGEATT